MTNLFTNLLVNLFFIGLAMAIVIIIYALRWLIWKERSWAEAIYRSRVSLIGLFFFVGFPYGGCKLLLGFVTGEEPSHLLCFGVGLLGALLILCYLQWIDPWLENRPGKVKAACPRCAKWKLRVTSDVHGPARYYCTVCGWKGSMRQVWPELFESKADGGQVTNG